MSILRTPEIIRTASILTTLLFSCPAWAESVETATWLDFTPVREQPGLVVGVLGLLLVWGYYNVARFLSGRRASLENPPDPTVAPMELSPAMARYLMVRQVDEHCVLAALVSMADKGAITIEEQHGTYLLTRTGTNRRALAPDEVALATALFEGTDEIQLRTETYDKMVGTISHVKDKRWQDRKRLASQLERATRKFARALKGACSPRYVSHNAFAWAFGMVLSVAVVAIALYAEPYSDPLQAMVGRIATLFVTVVVLATPLVGKGPLWVEWRKHLLERSWKPLLSGAGILVSIPTFVALLWASVPHINSGLAHRFVSPYVPLLALILLGMGMWFRVSFRTLTAEGRRVLDQLNAKAGHDRISFVMALEPDATPQTSGTRLPSYGTMGEKSGSVPGRIPWTREFGNALARAMLYSSQPQGWGAERVFASP